MIQHNAGLNWVGMIDDSQKSVDDEWRRKKSESLREWLIIKKGRVTNNNAEIILLRFENYSLTMDTSTKLLLKNTRLIEIRGNRPTIKKKRKESWSIDGTMPLLSSTCVNLPNSSRWRWELSSIPDEKKSSSDFVSITHDKWFQEICQLFLFLTRLEGYNRWMMDDHLHDIKYDKFHENNFRAAFFDWM